MTPTFALIAPDLALWADEPLTTSAVVVGSSVFAVLGLLTALALVALPLRGLALALHASRRWQASRLLRSTRAPSPVDLPPLQLDGLSPGLSRLARQTRTLTLELRRCATRAQTWPEDQPQEQPRKGAEAPPHRSGWRTVLGEGLDYGPILEIRREVFEWLHAVDSLGDADRERLDALGIEPGRVRQVLTREGPVVSGVRDLAGLLAGVDARLGASSTGYRGAPSPAAAEPRVLSQEDDEEDARAAVLFAHRARISSIAGRYARSRTEREDLEQDIALAVWRALPTFRGESRLDTYVSRVAKFRCYRALRRRGRLPLEPDAEVEAVDPDADPETHLLRADDRARLERAIDDLPGNLATPLGLHLRGLSYAEIAAELGITERNVSVRLTRARHRLRLELA